MIGDLALLNRGPSVCAKPNFSKQFNLICPVQSWLKKFFVLPVGQIISTSPPVPSLKEGRFAIVTDVRRDAVDAGGAADERAYLADGEVVWS